MKLVPIFTIFIALFSGAFSDSKDEDVKKFNKLVDEVLTNFRTSSMVEKVDPLVIDKMTDSGMTATDIIVRGISNSYRNGDCSLQLDGDTIILTGNIAADDLKVSLNYKGNFMYLFIGGTAEGDLKKIAIRVKIHVEGGKANLKTLKVLEMEGYTLTRLTGFGPIHNFIMKKFYNALLKLIKPIITKKFEEHMFPVMQSLISSVTVPDI